MPYTHNQVCELADLVAKEIANAFRENNLEENNKTCTISVTELANRSLHELNPTGLHNASNFPSKLASVIDEQSGLVLHQEGIHYELHKAIRNGVHAYTGEVTVSVAQGTWASVPVH